MGGCCEGAAVKDSPPTPSGQQAGNTHPTGMLF